jgi:uncharacterized membrane protein
MRDTRWHWLTAHQRLGAALVLGVVLGLTVLRPLGPSLRFAAAWDGGVLFFLALSWWAVERCPKELMRETVLANDQGRVGILAIVLLAIAASVAAIFFLLQPTDASDAATKLQVVIAVATIVCSWVLTHVMFALHYAHRFYRDDPSTPEQDATRGLAFPGTKDPHYWDFVYFSFVIGMTSQVSDVQVTSHGMRRLVLAHGVLSFAFYTVVLALSINIVAGLL